MAYGSPERDEDIEAYYTHIRGGRKPTAEELENLKLRYRAIGGRSPLYGITKSTADKLEKQLSTRVYVGMKHWHPFISEAFDEISKEGVTDVVAVALAPHFSRMSIGAYQSAVEKANEEHWGKVRVKYINEWYLDPIFIEKWEERITRALKDKFAEVIDREAIYFLFSAHSLPERILTWNDPYKIQLLETADKLAGQLNLASKQFGFAFQSAGHTSEPWLGPDIIPKIKELGENGWKYVLVIPIGFVSDHLEILYDIDIEAKQIGDQLGIRVERTGSFNDSDDFIEILTSVCGCYKQKT